MATERGLQMANFLAIPGTGHGWRFNGLRSPRNVGVRKALLAELGTLRGQKYPPSSWDDLWKANLRDRNWKRFRKTRWHRVHAA